MTYSAAQDGTRDVLELVLEVRNIAVALGNTAPSAEITAALRARADDPDPVVREHVAWALDRHAVR